MGGVDETSRLINNGNNNQDSLLRERVSKYLLPVMVVVIALVVTALTATVATSITMATYKRCRQDTSVMDIQSNGSCITPTLHYNISVSHQLYIMYNTFPTLHVLKAYYYYS